MGFSASAEFVFRGRGFGKMIRRKIKFSVKSDTWKRKEASKRLPLRLWEELGETLKWVASSGVC